ncbi:lamin tail domain-containing protein [bacterium]|nr:lamin tail domain-containing protein [bacterium]
MKGILFIFLFCQASLSAQNLVISEFMAANTNGLKDEDGDRSDWLEILNVSSAGVNLAGWSLTDDPAQPTQWTFPPLTLGANQRVLIFASDKDRSDAAGELHANFKLKASGDYLALVQPNGTTVEHGYIPTYPDQFDDISYGLGELGGQAVLIEDDAVVRYSFPGDDTNDVYIGGALNLGTSWIHQSFGDTGWASGPLGIGYTADDPDPYDAYIQTDVQESMLGGAIGIYMRSSFTLASATEVNGLTLRIRHDDGFVAYLNGNPVPVASANAPTDPTALAYDSVGENHPDADAVAVKEFVFSASDYALTSGVNVLAVHGLNQATTSNDALWKWELVGELASMGLSGNRNYFTRPSPGVTNGEGLSNPGPMIGETTDTVERLDVSGGSSGRVITTEVQATAQGIASVDLRWRVMYDAEKTTAMNDAGTGDDVMAGDGIYTGKIVTTNLLPGEMIRWRVMATDVGGEITTDPAFLEPLDSPEYHGTVAKNSSESTSQLPILHWFVDEPSAADSRTGTRGSCYFLGQFYDNILTDLHGQSTASFSKKSYDFDFNKGERFRYAEGERRVKDINLLTNWADKSKVRNSLGYGLMAEIGAPVHFSFPVRVQQNGSFFSTADMVEDGDERYLDRVGLDENGALYKMYSRIDSGQLSFEKKTRRDEGSADLTALRTSLLQSSAAKLTYAYDNVNLPGLVNYMAARVMISDRDHGHKNYYVYRDSEGSGEWVPLIWDIDLNWGRNWIVGLGYFDDTLSQDNSLDPFPGNDFYNLIYDNPELLDMYLRRLRTVNDQILGPPGTVNARVDVVANEVLERLDPGAVVTTDADLDYAKWGSWGNDHRAGEATNRLITEHLPGRRSYIYETMAGIVPPAQATNRSVSITMGEFSPSSGNPLEEYFTLSHPHSEAVDISSWVIGDAVRMTIPAGTVIPSGKTLHIARNAKSFRSRSTSPTGGEQRFVIHGYAGQLSARGETITLHDDQGTLVDSLTYTGAPSAMQSALRVSEVQYNPADPTDAELAINGQWDGSDFEYVELTNTGSIVLNLSGAQFADGIVSTFTPGTTLAPGAHLVVVSDEAAFRARYGGIPVVAGAYTGRLNNDGESVKLLDDIGENILEFTYNDTWHTPTDGKGYALVIRDIGAGFETWAEEASWAAGGAALGTPGAEETRFSVTLPEWTASKFSVSEQADPSVSGVLADPDGDGVSNLLEYALGTDPEVSDGVLEGLVVGHDSNSYLALSFTRITNAADLTYLVEIGNDLTGWSMNSSVVDTVDQGDDAETVIVRDLIPLQEPPAMRRFMRLRVIHD